MLDRILLKPTNRKSVRVLLKEQDLINKLRIEEMHFINAVLNLEQSGYTYRDVYYWHKEKFEAMAKHISTKLKYTAINIDYFSQLYKPIEKEYQATIITNLTNKLRKHYE
jgi:hypothetical protein